MKKLIKKCKGGGQEVQANKCKGIEWMAYDDGAHCLSFLNCVHDSWQAMDWLEIRLI
jgi:hypothetical protein